MFTTSDTTIDNRAKSATAKKLIQATAFAAMLVPLGAVTADAATITCFSDGGGCSGGTGSYSPTGSGSNIWKFFSGDPYNNTLLYTLEIEGKAATDPFSLAVQSRHVSRFPGELEGPAFDIAFLGGECIPFLDENTCVIFDVSAANGTPVWDANGYYMEMRWFAPEGVPPGESPLRPPANGNNHIYRSADGFLFNDRLFTELYDPFPDPTDPALGGRGDSFSSFIAGRDDVPIPEPGTFLLLGSGLVTALARRRRKQQS